MVYGSVFSPLLFASQSGKKMDQSGISRRTVSAPLRLRSVGHVCRIRAECCGYDAKQGTGCGDHSGDHGGGHDHHRIHRRDHFYPRYACETVGLHEGKRQYQRYHLPQVFSHMGYAGMRVLFLCQPVCGGLGPLAFAASGIFLFHRHVFRSVRHRPLVFSQRLRQGAEIRTGKGYRGQVRGAEGLSGAAAGRAGRKEAFYACIQD